MAYTYYIADALNIVNRQFGRNVEDQAAAIIANIAINKIWMRYDWRETIATLPPFYLIPLEQDYGAPWYAVPTDFLGLRTAYLTRTDVVPPFRMPLQIVKDLKLTHMRSLPSSIDYNADTAKIRVFPRVPDNIAAPTWMIDGTYKKMPTKITPATLNSSLIPWSDLYFQNFCAVLRASALEMAGDPRADNELRKALMSLDEMAQNEGINLGDPQIFPSEGMYGGFNSSPFGSTLFLF